MSTHKLIPFALALFLAGATFSQTQQKTKVSPPSDQVTGYTYDFDKTKQLIIDRLVNPSASNLDAKLLVEAADFPQIKDKTVSPDFLEKLRGWMEKNPTLITNTLKHRKDIVTPF